MYENKQAGQVLIDSKYLAPGGAKAATGAAGAAAPMHQQPAYPQQAYPQAPQQPQVVIVSQQPQYPAGYAPQPGYPQ